MTEARLVTALEQALHNASVGCEWNPIAPASHDGDHRVDASALIATLAAVGYRLSPAAAPAEGLREALDNLVVAVDALEARAIRFGGEFHVWAEERMVTEARDEARAALVRHQSGSEL